MNEKEARERVEKYIKSFNGNALDCVAIGTVLTLLENKDKIIDLMANSFAEEGFYSEHCQTLIDNDICSDDCNKCIKQYFEKKVEENN